MAAPFALDAVGGGGGLRVSRAHVGDRSGASQVVGGDSTSARDRSASQPVGCVSHVSARVPAEALPKPMAESIMPVREKVCGGHIFFSAESHGLCARQRVATVVSRAQERHVLGLAARGPIFIADRPAPAVACFSSPRFASGGMQRASTVNAHEPPAKVPELTCIANLECPGV